MGSAKSGHNQIDWWRPISFDTQTVPRAVTLTSCVFSPHNVFMCFFDTCNNQRLFPLRALTVSSSSLETQRVFFEVGTGNAYELPGFQCGCCSTGSRVFYFYTVERWFRRFRDHVASIFRVNQFQWRFRYVLSKSRNKQTNTARCGNPKDCHQCSYGVDEFLASYGQHSCINPWSCRAVACSMLPAYCDSLVFYVLCSLLK